MSAVIIGIAVAGVYISFPFCAQKCTFCNFASGVATQVLRDCYHAALLTEIAAANFPWMPRTLYLGGGTPSAMPLDQFDELLAAIPGKPWDEATIECAPGDITTEKIRSWREAGINRVSLGVQSFVSAELRRTGRKHTAEVVAREVAMLRDGGIPNINVDLIAGLPGQTEASWSESLDEVERLAPPHVSVYMLEIDEDSRLGAEMLTGGVRYGAADAPDEDQTAGFYEEAVRRLKAMGIPRYEISNFARGGFVSQHNLKYWRREPYLGFGADAHSCMDGLRWQNAESAEEYVRLRPHPRIDQSAVHEPEEKFFVGLRLTEGIEPSSADWDLHGSTIRRFLNTGMMESQGSRLRLTDRGVMLSNEVFAEFLAA